MEQGNNTSNQPDAPTSAPQPEPTSQSGPTPPPTPTPEQSHDASKKPKALITTAIICAILAVAGIAFGIYGMFFQPQPSCETNCDQTSDNDSKDDSNPSEIEEEVYKVSDYVAFVDATIPTAQPEGTTGERTESVIKKVELSNLPQGIIQSFNTAQNKLIDEGTNIYSCENNAGAAIDDGILSVYTVYSYSLAYGNYGEAITLNYNLETGNELSNTELLSQYSLTSEGMYEAILKQLVQNVTTESFLLDTHGDVTAPTISVTEFTNNIPEYKKVLSADPSAVKLYVDGSQLHALYEHYDILENLGMGTHMGAGLKGGVQDIAL